MGQIDKIQDRLDSIADEIELLTEERERLEKEFRSFTSGPGVFGFLYDRSDPDYGYHRDLYRTYKARSLNEAARKFAGLIERRGWDVLVDSEADHEGNHIDMYQIGESHPLYPFLP